MTTTEATKSGIKARISLDLGWNRVPGLQVTPTETTIDPSQYFFRYEEPAWNIIDWEFVRDHWSELDESNDAALEQRCLEFIRKHARITDNPSEVLENAEKVYSHLF